MSSEESGDENEDPKPVLYVHSLLWRSAKVNKLFSVLDSQIEKGKSKRALSQTYTRVVGDHLDFPADFWGLWISDVCALDLNSGRTLLLITQLANHDFSTL